MSKGFVKKRYLSSNSHSVLSAKKKMLSTLRTGVKINFPFRKQGRQYTVRSFSRLIDFHPNVQEALSSGRPVVALESTIITHGMPFPLNLETALAVEETVAKEGSTAATIAVIDGRIKVGLNEEQLARLANPDAGQAVKCSRRDLAYTISRKLCGGTTVAGTSIIANLAGIKVFATGGIGGVHREGHVTLDISADLIELGRTPIAVVASGIKSILDIPRTLEYLETQGVCVASYQSPSSDFPAFYTRSSGSKAPYNLSGPEEAAALINSSLELNLRSGILIGVPIPEEHAVPEEQINKAIEKALIVAREKGIAGKEVTPFVLEAVSKITKGKSLTSNIALIKNNALVASRIAVQLQKIRSLELPETSGTSAVGGTPSGGVPVVVGASILDMCLQVNDNDLQLNGATYIVESKSFGGGVGRNIAEGICKLYGDVHLISAVGNDEIGKNVKGHLPVSCQGGIITAQDHTTSMCTVIFDHSGDCKLVLGDMSIHKCITPELILTNEKAIARSPLVVFDGNLSLDTMTAVLDIAKKYNKPVFFEPTDMRIAGKPFQLPRDLTKQIKFISPNLFELKEIIDTLNKHNHETSKHSVDFSAGREEILKRSKDLLNSIRESFDCIVLTLGEHGVVISRNIGTKSFFNERVEYIPPSGEYRNHFYQAKPVENVVNVSGAGDSFTSGFIAAMLNGKHEKDCVKFGFHAARCALRSEGAVPREYFSREAERDSHFQHEAKFMSI